MKLSRDPVTGYPTIQIADTTIVLKKDAEGTPKEIMNQPAKKVVECAI